MSQPGNRRFGRLVLVSVLAFTLLAASCGGGDGSAGGDPPTETGPAYGGEIVYGVEAGNSGGWCLPEAQLALSGIQMGKAIYEPLTAPNADGDYVPFLAESIEPNEGYTTWTTKLRPGIKFHDGTDLNAEVVKNNIDAYRGAYSGRDAVLFSLVLSDISDVTVVDDLTVQTTTKTPWVTVPAYLHGGGRLGIMAQAQLDDADNCHSNLIGTGPFMLEEWSPNDHFTAIRNPDYWQSDSQGNQLPYLDKITFRPFPDPDARANSLLSGQLDMMHIASPQQQEVLIEEEAAGNLATYSTTEFTDVNYLMFNSGAEPFDNIDARMAVAHAFDADDFNEVINLNLAEMASGPFPPGNLGHLDDAGFPDFDVDEAEAAAQRYSEAAGKPLSFTLTVAADPQSLAAAQYFQATMRDIGVEVDLVSVEQAALINNVLGGGWNVALWRNHPGGDPDLENPWWNSDSPVNLGRFSDAEIDALLARGRAEPDKAERDLIYQEVNKRLASQAYNLWTNWTPWMIAGDPGSGGVLGPDLPDGSAPFPGLASGHPVSGLHASQ